MEYKSSLRKLVQCFQKSRNRWKDKAQEAKKALKLSRNRIRFLESSKAKFKAEVNELKRQVLTYQNKKSLKKTPLTQVSKKK